MARILAALSGGVDSSVAAALLVDQGHEVVGAYMKNWINEDKILGNCPWEEDIRDARAVAEALGIEFRVVNLMRDYKDRVVAYLLDGYRRGLTPNPDVMCNREMKFGVFREYAKAEGFEKVATGHYARLREKDGAVDILRGIDPNKDQTYFLALLRQHQAASALFPIGDLPKPEVRETAKRFGLPTATKKDSQGICFIGEIKMADFLETYVEEDPGPIVDTEGRHLGTHRGLHFYTLGQRKGVGVASPHFKRPYVVVEKRFESKELVMGFDEPETPNLYASRCLVGQISFVNEPFRIGETDLLAQPRYRTEAVPMQLCRFDAEGGQAEIEFSRPQRALTPGQICAFYRKDVLLGGGVFQRIDYEN